MSGVLIIGSALGGVVGLLHGAVLYRNQRRRGASDGAALYTAIWTFALWTLFGAYVLSLWVLAGLAYTGYLIWLDQRPRRRVIR